MKRLKSVFGRLIRRNIRLSKVLAALLFASVLVPVVIIHAESSIPLVQEPQVSFYAPSGSTITFFENNAAITDDGKSLFQTLPQLVLFRNGELTEPDERTLIIEIGSLDLPPSGAFITVDVTTQNHVSMSAEEPGMPIQVWRETKWVYPSTIDGNGAGEVEFRHEFKDFITLNGKPILTPTDYFRVDIRITDDGHPSTRPLYRYSRDYAFLMENQYLANLPQVLEDSPGAAPNELMVFYCDTFFPNDWLGSILNGERNHIHKYVESELIPAMLDAYQTESLQWGFPWYAEWESYRKEDTPGRLSAALTKKDTWYHGIAPEIGNANISINLHSAENDRYHDLTESVISNFYHELFHVHQRNINLHLGGDGDIDGLEDAWQYFSEGMAVLASSVGQPEVQFARTPGLRTYLVNANGFFAGGGPVRRDIYMGYRDIYPNHAAIYWRFLYEQCGGMSSGEEESTVGMSIIRKVLEVLYSMDIVDIGSSTDLVEHMPDIMDKAFRQGAACPFTSFEDSINQFARAIYSLKLENGRCLSPGIPMGCWFYDPEDLYFDLPIPRVEYSSDQITIESGEMRDLDRLNCFGMRFIEIELDQSTNGKPILMELKSDLSSPASLNLQVIQLKSRWEQGRLETAAAVSFSSDDAHNSRQHRVLAFSIPEIEIEKVDRLALIITRTDNHQFSGSSGEFTLVLK